MQERAVCGTPRLSDETRDALGPNATDIVRDAQIRTSEWMINIFEVGPEERMQQIEAIRERMLRCQEAIERSAPTHSPLGILCSAAEVLWDAWVALRRLDWAAHFSKHKKLYKKAFGKNGIVPVMTALDCAACDFFLASSADTGVADELRRRFAFQSNAVEHLRSLAAECRLWHPHLENWIRNTNYKPFPFLRALCEFEDRAQS